MKKTEKNTTKVKNQPQEKQTNGFWVRTIIFIVIALAFCSTFFFKDKIENLINYNLNKSAVSTVIEEDGLIIHFVDVNQADCTIVEFPTGEIMVIDTGDNNSESNQKLQNYLKTINFEYEKSQPVIDFLVLTHPHADHIGGAPYLFENYLIKNCYLPQVYYSNPENPSENPFNVPEGAIYTTDDTYLETLTLLKAEMENDGCNKNYSCDGLEICSSGFVRSQASNNSDMWVVDFFAPLTGYTYTEGSSLEADPNNYSPIIILNYLNKKIMFTGDIEKKAENHFLEKVEQNYFEFNEDYFDVDILHVAHHGAKTSSTKNFLALVQPEIAVIPVGKNSYGHPTEQTLTNLKEAGVSENNIYRTDINGNIAVGVSKEGKLALSANHVQYTTIEIKLWQIVIVAVGISAIIIYFPYIKKVIKIKKSKSKI